MHAQNERRREPRVHYSWPLWFRYDNCRELNRGTVFDLSKSAVSFSVPQDQCPAPGTHLVTRFGYPCLVDEALDMDTYHHYSEVSRVQPDKPGFCRVVLQLHQPLEHQPHPDVPDYVSTVAPENTPINVQSPETANVSQEYAEAFA